MLGVKGGHLHAKVLVEGTDYIEALESFVVSERSKQLNAVVQSVSSFLVHDEAGRILHRARKARNEIAHEAASGFDYAITEPEVLNRVYSALRESVRAVAEGDNLVSVLLSRLNGDPLFVGNYVDLVVAWVCDVEPDGTAHLR
ncbi:MAG: hypothetical protein JJE51_12705 [Thermoanaerobaculia bacterium]|nr:hypothetical protein [Thermoanaerobaculia bacterium]